MKDFEIELLSNQFLSQLRDSVDEVEADLLRLEQRQDPELLRSVFRAFHTIKGNAGLVGQAEIQTACHSVEAALSAETPGSIAPEVIQDSLRLVYALRACARAESADGYRTELERLASVAGARADGAGFRATEAGTKDTVAGDPNRPYQAAGGQTAPLSLDDFRRIVRHFAPIWRADLV